MSCVRDNAVIDPLSQRFTFTVSSLLYTGLPVQSDRQWWNYWAPCWQDRWNQPLRPFNRSQSTNSNFITSQYRLEHNVRYLSLVLSLSLSHSVYLWACVCVCEAYTRFLYWGNTVNHAILLAVLDTIAIFDWIKTKEDVAWVWEIITRWRRTLASPFPTFVLRWQLLTCCFSHRLCQDKLNLHSNWKFVLTR